MISKKITATILAAFMSMSFAAGCGSSDSSQPQSQQQESASSGQKIDKETQEQLNQIKKQTDVVDLQNGAKNKVIGKVGVMKIKSSEFDKIKDVWFTKWAKEKVDSHEWNYAIVVFTDKKDKGAAYNGLFQIGCQISRNSDGTYSIGKGGDAYVEDTDNPGHVKKLNLDKQ